MKTETELNVYPTNTRVGSKKESNNDTEDDFLVGFLVSLMYAAAIMFAMAAIVSVVLALSMGQPALLLGLLMVLPAIGLAFGADQLDNKQGCYDSHGEMDSYFDFGTRLMF